MKNVQGCITWRAVIHSPAHTCSLLGKALILCDFLPCLVQPFDHGVGDATAVGGGALYLLKSDATLQNCVLNGNSDSRRGGAIGGAYSTLVMSQCYLHDNLVHVRGSEGEDAYTCLLCPGTLWIQVHP